MKCWRRFRQRDTALRQAQNGLEQRVQERTEELAHANKELELRNHEVERATKLKSKFLASMSHELRTPLNAIVGFSDLMHEETAGPLNDKQKRFVNHIKQGSAHLLQLINDILDLSKIEAGQLEFHCQNFPIRDALPEVLSTIRPLAMAKNIQVQQKVETERIGLCGSGSFQAGPVQPAEQCRQIHSARGADQYRLPRCRGVHQYFCDRHRHWHSRGRPGGCLRGIPAS